jgi:MFS family permease
MGPLFVEGLGYPPEVTGLFIGALIFGGALAQWPVGYLSDRTDRRHVIIGMAGTAVVVALLLPVFAGRGEGWLIGTGILFGAAAVPAFGLTVAHANDHAEPGTSVSVNGSLLLLYGCAATVGPLVASQLMRFFGTDVLFTWIAGVYLALVVFGLIRLRQRAAPKETEPYVPIMRTNSGIFELDPRADPAEDGAALPEAAIAGEPGGGAPSAPR